MKIIGSVVIIAVSFFAGYLYTDKHKKRITDITALLKLVEHMGMCIQMFKTPLDEIYHDFKSSYLEECSFFDEIERGIYYAAENSGLLNGEEEKEILRLFDEKIGTGSADDSVALCSFTAGKLRKLEENLSNDLPERLKMHRTIFLLTGISIIIVLI